MPVLETIDDIIEQFDSYHLKLQPNILAETCNIYRQTYGCTMRGPLSVTFNVIYTVKI